MSYSQEELLEKEILRFFAKNEDDDDDRYFSLTTIDEILGTHLRSYGLSLSDQNNFPKQHLKAVLDKLVQDDLLISKLDEGEYENAYRLTGQGVYETSGFGDVLVAEEVDEALALRADEQPTAENKSTDWTGLATKVTPSQLREIKQKIQSLNDAILQSDADAQTKLNAVKRVEAVQLLLEAPDVPWREVVDLLNSPSLAAFLTVLNIIQFIIGLAK